MLFTTAVWMQEKKVHLKKTEAEEKLSTRNKMESEFPKGFGKVMKKYLYEYLNMV